jgi:hypothetical protein
MAAGIRAAAGLATRVVTAAMAVYVTGLLACYFFAALGIKRHHLESASFIFVALLLLRIWLMPPGHGDVPPGRVAGIAVLMALVAAIAYSRALSVGFLSDDYVIQSWILDGRVPWDGSRFVRPVALTLWHVILSLAGGSVALHVLSIALHATNGALAACLAARLGLSRPAVIVAALVFVLWPTQVEAVVWAAALFDVLAATWVLLAVLLCLRETPLVSDAVDVSLVCALAALALFTKESAVALPVLALIAAAPRWVRARGWQKRGATLLAILAGATVAYLIWRVSAGLPVAGTPTFSRYVLKEQLSRTFATLAAPLSIETIGGHPIVAWLFAAVVVILAATATLGPGPRQNGHVVAAQGMSWSLIAAAPTLGFLLIGAYLDGSRYLYLPALGWGLTLGGLLDASSRDHRARLGTAALLAGLVGCAALQQQRSLSDWRAAATERDRILREAVALATAAQCDEVSVEQLPRTFKGAQLFNNGFAEALRAARPSRGPRQCRWTWAGGAFRPD